MRDLFVDGLSDGRGIRHLRAVTGRAKVNGKSRSDEVENDCASDSRIRI